MKLTGINVLKDNYIWILYNNNNYCVIFDPGEYNLTLKFIKNKNLIPIAIFLTHDHIDHVAGVKKLLKYFNITVFGSKETIKFGTNYVVSPGEIINILNVNFKVIFLPGHTKQHIGFYSDPWLFSGDTIFSAGCGKVITGTINELFLSLKKINNFPENTIICFSHEYTIENLNFALSIFPRDKIFINFKKKIVKQLKKNNKICYPTILSLERKINLFLRCNEKKLKKKLNLNLNENEKTVFNLLRLKKDLFKNKIINY